MGWTTLTLRKAELRRDHAIYEEQDLQLSREKRAIERQLHYEQTVFNNEKSSQLRDAKSDLTAKRKEKDNLKGEDGKIDYESDEYKTWADEYSDAQNEYEAAKLEINDYYDEVMADIEEEASDREAMIEQQQTEIEALMEDISQEIQAVSQAISSQIQSTTIKLS